MKAPSWMHRLAITALCSILILGSAATATADELPATANELSAATNEYADAENSDSDLAEPAGDSAVDSGSEEKTETVPEADSSAEMEENSDTDAEEKTEADANSSSVADGGDDPATDAEEKEDAAPETDPSADTKGKSEADPCPVMSWDQLKAAVEAAAADEMTYIRLEADCRNENENEANAGIHVTGKVQIDLNGHTIDRGCGNAEAPVEGGSVFVVNGSGEEQKAVLTVTDSSVPDEGSDNDEKNAGRITGGNTTGSGGGIRIGSYGSFTLEHGSVEGNAATTFGGGIYSLGGDVTIRGRVTGNYVMTEDDSTERGAGIYMDASDGTEGGKLTIEKRTESAGDPVKENYRILSSDKNQKTEDNTAEKSSLEDGDDEKPDPDEDPVDDNEKPDPDDGNQDDSSDTTEKGKIRLAVVTKAEGYTWNLTGRQKSALAGRVLTADEKARIEAGEDASLRLELYDITDTIDSETKKLLTASLGAKYSAAAYLEIRMTKKLSGDADATQVSDLDSAVSLTIGIPERLSKSENISAFYVRRPEGEKTVTVKTSLDSADGTLTYNTKQLAICALISKNADADDTASDDDADDISDDSEDDPDDADSGDSDASGQQEKGKIRLSAVSLAEGFTWQLTDAEKSKLAGIALTDAEKTRYRSGESVELKLELHDITDTIDSEVKDTLTSDLSSRYTAATYLEIVLYKKLSGDSDYVRVETLDKTISLTIGIPESLAGETETRSFYVRRPDGSDTKTVRAEYGSEEKTLSFNTKQLSVLTIIYSDSGSEADDGNGDSSASGNRNTGSGSTGTGNTGKSGSSGRNSNAASAAKTGDTANAAGWGTILIGSILLLWLLVDQKRNA